MLGLAADEADSLDKVLQAVQATVQVLCPCTLHHCLWGRHTADTTFLLGWEELACLVCLLTKWTASAEALKADEHSAWRHLCLVGYKEVCSLEASLPALVLSP